MVDRPSGMLTDIDREFLQSEGEYYEGKNARQSRYHRRRDIRARITQSLLDFQYFPSVADEKLRTPIFEDPEKSGAKSKHEFEGALRALIYWLYLGYRETDQRFDNILEPAIEAAERDFRMNRGETVATVDVNFDVTVTKPAQHIEDLSQRLMNGEEVSTHEIYEIPLMDQFPIDPEKVDTVKIKTASTHLRVESEKSTVDNILQTHLGIDAEIEIIDRPMISSIINRKQKNEMVGKPEDEMTAAVPIEEYDHRD